MYETIHRLDYEQRVREWLKRRAKFKPQPRECHQKVRASQKREEKILVQKLAGVDLAIRMRSLDFKREVQTVEALQKTILARSVKFDKTILKRETTPYSGGTDEMVSRRREGRFRQGVPSGDRTGQGLMQIPKAIKGKSRQDFKQNKSSLVSGNTDENHDYCAPSNQDPRKLLFVISENTNTEEKQHTDPTKDVPSVTDEDLKHSCSSGSQMATLHLEKTVSPISVVRRASVCIGESSRRGGPDYVQRRSSASVQRSSERLIVRPMSTHRGSQASRPTSASTHVISTNSTKLFATMPRARSSTRCQQIDKFGNDYKSQLSYQREADDQQTALRFHPFRSLSCDVTQVAEIDVGLNRPQTADAICKPLNRLCFGSDSRSFKTLRDIYKRVYREDLDPASKRVMALRLQETLNLQRLQARVQDLCTKMQFILSDKTKLANI